MPADRPVYYTILPSPLGELRLTGDGHALTGLYMSPHAHAPATVGWWVRDPAPFAEAARQLAEYFAGTRTAFDLPLAAAGTPFQQRVWAALRDIPYGETRAYGALARAIGAPSASRAVGLANGRNPLSIVVPCHRVVGSTGALTGYGGGVERKRWLLALEARPAGAAGG